MSLEQILKYIVDHNKQVIEWSVFFIFLTGGLAVFWTFFSKDKSKGETNSLADIEATLKNLLSQSGGVIGAQTQAPVGDGLTDAPAEAPTAAAGNVAAAASDGATQAIIAEKEKVIAELKAQLANSKPDESEKYLARIKELEAKLHEYEIIEDDIADLSAYKEENAKLKAELAKFTGEEPAAVAKTESDGAAPTASAEVKEGEVSAADPLATTEVGPNKVAETLSEMKNDIVAEFESAVIQTKSGEKIEADASPAAAPTAAAPTTAKVEEPAGDDIMAEFEPLSTEELAEQVNEDLVAEFSASITAKPPPNEEPLNPEGGESEAANAEASASIIDTEKMMEEMANLTEAAEGTNALEEEMDVDKMAAEATKLAAADNQ